MSSYLAEERELLLLWLRFSLSLDILDVDRERLLDFFDSEQLRDLFFDSDLLLDFFDREERLRDLLFDNDRFLLLDREADFLHLEGDLVALERFDSTEEDLDRGERCCFVLVFGDDFFVLEADLEIDRRPGDADFLPRERDRDFLSPDGDLEDLTLSTTDGDLVHDLDADLEYDLVFFGDLDERRFNLVNEIFSEGGGDSLGERSFIIMLSSLDIATGEREADSLFDASFFEDTIDGESFLPEELGDLENWLFVLLLVFIPGDMESTLSKDCWGNGSDGGDSLGDLILIAASSRVRGRAGEGDLLDTGDWMTGKAWITGSFDLDLSRIGTVEFCAMVFGGSFGKAIFKKSSRLSIMIFVGLITFFSRVSRAFAARPLCNRFNVFNSIILLSSSSSCWCCLLGSSSAKSASSSLDDLRLTLGATAICCVFLLLDVERDLTLSPLVFFFWSRRGFRSSKMSL